jgi:RNA polymerase sigma factor (sigma-70 family)
MATAPRQDDHRFTVARYLSEVRGMPSLTKEEEIDLATRVQKGREGGPTLLIEANLSYVVKVASEYRGLGIPFEDLVNEGNLGLVLAAKRYDPRRGNKFITYAIWWIRKSILRAVSDQSRVVRLPGSFRRHIREAGEIRESLRRTLGREPEDEEIAVRMTRGRRTGRIPMCGPMELSLDESSGDDGGRTMHDRLADERSSTPEEEILVREAESVIEEAMNRLDDKERAVIRYRFGFGGERPLKLRQVGERMGISGERVRQIEVQAKNRLRRYLSRRSQRGGSVPVGLDRGVGPTTAQPPRPPLRG